MATTSVNLQAVLTVKDKMTRGLKQSEGGLKSMAKTAAIAGAGVATALGVASVKAAAKFESSIADVATLLGTAGNKEIPKFEKGIKEILKTSPKSAEELGASAYAIVSAGFTDAASAMKVLNNAQKLATAGLGTTEEATTLLTVAMNAFEKQGLSAEDTTDVLFKTVKNGITNVAQLSQAFGKMAGNAVSANITLEDASAATAALSAITGKTAESQNALAQVFLELTQSGGKLDTQLQKNGSSVDELNAAIAEKGGLGAGMKEIIKKTGLTETEFKNLFSSAEGGTAVFQLLTAGTDNYNASLDDMKNGTNAVDEAMKIQTGTTQNQYNLLKNQLNVEMVNLGTKIIPALLTSLEAGKLIWNEWVDTLSNVWLWLWKVDRQLSAVTDPSRNMALQTGPIGAIRGLFGKQFGGAVNRGQPYMVGEAGPELFVPYQSGSIVPNNKMGSTVTVNFNNATVRSDYDLQTIVAAVKQELNRSLELHQAGV